MNREIISKELLSEVLGEDILSFNFKNNEIFIQFKNYDDIWNIHELAHRCKEWARDNGYIVSSSVTKSLKGFVHLKKKNGKPYKYRGKTENEAIFKACQWILENKDRQ